MEPGRLHLADSNISQILMKANSPAVFKKVILPSAHASGSPAAPEFDD